VLARHAAFGNVKNSSQEQVHPHAHFLTKNGGFGRYLQRDVGSNPTPRTKDKPDTLQRIFQVLCMQQKKGGFSGDISTNGLKAGF